MMNDETTAAVVTERLQFTSVPSAGAGGAAGAPEPTAAASAP